MFDIDRWQEVWMTISKNRSRSLLTAFGVFWGVFMLMILLGGGNAFETMLNNQLAGFATNSGLVVTNRTSEAYKGFRKGRSWELNSSDINRMKVNIKGLEYVVPANYIWPNGNNVAYADKTGSYTLKGIFPENIHIEKKNLLYGRYINEIDEQEGRKVCVIGDRVYEVLFKKGENPVGKYIRANGIYFQVIGVSKAVSENMKINSDPAETIEIPFSLMKRTFNMGDDVHIIMFTVKKNVSVSSLQKNIEKLIKENHQISPTDSKALWFMNLEEQFKIINNVFVGVSILIWIVGLGTLFAGVMGVSNIMMVTVRERTQEIGVRRALGARPKQIIGQILTETIVLTGLAGIMGIVAGVGLLQAVGIVMSNGDGVDKGFQVSFGMAVASTIVILVLSTLAGLAPAYRAMQIKPIDALRDE